MHKDFKEQLEKFSDELSNNSDNKGVTEMKTRKKRDLGEFRVTEELRNACRDARLDKGLSQLQLSETLEVDRMCVYQLETGRTKTCNSTVKRIAKYLGVDTSKYISDSDAYARFNRRWANKTIPTAFRTKVKKARIKAGLKQAELAELLGITNDAVSGVERGFTTYVNKNTEKIAKHFGIPLRGGKVQRSDAYKTGKSKNSTVSKTANDYTQDVHRVIASYGQSMYDLGKKEALDKLKESLGV